MDNFIFGKRKNYSSYVIILPSQELIPYVIPKDVEFTNNERIKNLLRFIEIDNDDWIQLNNDEILSGFNIKIQIDNYNYEVEINKKILPLRLLKKEFNNFYYKIIYGNNMPLFFMKKIFKNCIPNTNFTIMQIYHVL